jgi:steroid 5-alpha reductase family enzyme
MMRMVAITAGTVLAYMTVCFLVALLRQRNDIADVAWGPGFVLVSSASLLAGGATTWRGIMVTGLVLVWALRLALHIHVRNRGKGEDPRYRKWREEWGRWFVLRSFLQVFMLQGVLLLVVAVPIIVVNASPTAPLRWLDGLGLAVWLVGFGFEAIGDWQLLRFIRDPANRGTLMTGGLWRYTRHPNYFGEVTLWWGIWLIALAVPGGWLTIVGPLTITILILKVSGIPMLERRYEGRPDFEEYKRRTSPFFPLPPRTGGSLS